MRTRQAPRLRRGGRRPCIADGVGGSSVLLASHTVASPSRDAFAAAAAASRGQQLAQIGARNAAVGVVVEVRKKRRGFGRGQRKAERAVDALHHLAARRDAATVDVDRRPQRRSEHHPPPHHLLNAQRDFGPTKATAPRRRAARRWCAATRRWRSRRWRLSRRRRQQRGV